MYGRFERKVMGIYSNFERKERDWYPTPLKAAQPLFDYLNDQKTQGNFIEPCAGDGRLVTLIETHTDLHCVYLSDIDPQVKVKDTKKHQLIFQKTDILDEDWEYIARQTKADLFITNPPWVNTKDSGNLRLAIIQKLAKVRPTWLLLAGNYIMNEDMWSDFNGDVGVLHYCKNVIPIGRVKWIEDSKDVGKQDAAWYLFDYKHKGGPVVLPRRSYK